MYLLRDADDMTLPAALVGERGLTGLKKRSWRPKAAHDRWLRDEFEMGTDLVDLRRDRGFSLIILEYRIESNPTAA